WRIASRRAPCPTASECPRPGTRRDPCARRWPAGRGTGPRRAAGRAAAGPRPRVALRHPRRCAPPANTCSTGCLAGHRTASRRRRRAREAHADAPVIARRYEDEGEQAADEWFDVGAKTLLNPAAVAGRQEDAPPIRPMFQLPILPGAPARRCEPWLGGNLGII